MTGLWTSDEIVAATGGTLHGAPFDVSGVTFDSREVGSGDLFVAMPGSATDGHRFVTGAYAAGAAGAIVSSAVGGPHILVADVARAVRSATKGVRLQLADGTSMPLPAALVEVLGATADGLADGHSVTVLSADVSLTPAEVAELLGLSRPFVVRHHFPSPHSCSEVNVARPPRSSSLLVAESRSSPAPATVSLPFSAATANAPVHCATS